MADEIIPKAGAAIQLPGGTDRDVITPKAGAAITPPAPEPWWDTGDVAKSVGSKLVQGATAFADLPGNIASGGIKMVERATGYDIPENYERAMMVMNPLTAGRGVTGESITQAADKQIPSVMRYEPTSTAGRYSGNVAYMAPAAATAALTGGMSLVPSLVGGAVVPGISGELARDAAETVARSDYVGAKNPEKVGEYAKLAAELLTPFAAAKFLPSAGTVLKDPALNTAVDDISKVRAAGIDVTPGSYRTSQQAAIAGAEADLANPKMAAIIQKQPEQFSRFALNKFGVTDDIARANGFKEGLTPITAPKVVEAELRRIGPQIGATYDAVLARNFSPTLWAKIRYRASSLPGSPPFDPALGFTSGQWLHEVRKFAGKMQLEKGYDRNASKLIEEIDNAVGQAIGPQGMAALEAANAQFSRLTLLDDAFNIASTRKRAGVIHPQDIIDIGSNRHTSGVHDLAKTADNYLIPQNFKLASPPKRSGIGRAMWDTAAAAVSGLPAYGVMAGLSVSLPAALKSAAIAAGAAGVREAAAAALRTARGSAYGQNVARSKALYGTPMGSMLAGPASSAMADDRIGRKAGGRVGVDHDRLADRLVGAAERAKKGISRGTEQLLEMPDDHIAHALELANRSI